MLSSCKACCLCTFIWINIQVGISPRISAKAEAILTSAYLRTHCTIILCALMYSLAFRPKESQTTLTYFNEDNWRANGPVLPIICKVRRVCSAWEEFSIPKGNKLELARGVINRLPGWRRREDRPWQMNWSYCHSILYNEGGGKKKI